MLDLALSPFKKRIYWKSPRFVSCFASARLQIFRTDNPVFTCARRKAIWGTYSPKIHSKYMPPHIYTGFNTSVKRARGTPDRSSAQIGRDFLEETAMYMQYSNRTDLSLCKMVNNLTRRRNLGGQGSWGRRELLRLTDSLWLERRRDYWMTCR